MDGCAIRVMPLEARREQYPIHLRQHIDRRSSNLPVDQRQIDAPLDATRRRPQTLHLRIVLRQRLAVVVQHLADVVDALLREAHVAQGVAQHLVADAAARRPQEQLHGVQHGGEQLVEVLGHVAGVRQFGQRQVEYLGRALATLDVVHGDWRSGRSWLYSSDRRVWRSSVSECLPWMRTRSTGLDSCGMYVAYFFSTLDRLYLKLDDMIGAEAGTGRHLIV